ncbi:MAG: HEPN domain-containing protein [Alphaproteobacteria bacterium]|nr:HEPN domain-containing protein [Alphaproteobacteria bacterium]MDA8003328.1 HEPN domain-containing protein [Alphaproteobacteria bacterium]MDA8005339.1 HEPN domain-containing protein [Alphaproteobacteria bacterium]MDA8012613.1 HEPN domain-containing protein [Alphaproteobacteria bacterium]
MSAKDAVRPLSFESLKKMQRERRDAFPEHHGIRVHRALSWLERAEGEKSRGNLDIAFVSYWIAFNALYAPVPPAPGEKWPGEKMLFQKYFSTLSEVDEERIIYEETKKKFSPRGGRKSIDRLLENHHIFAPFWHHHHHPDKHHLRGWRNEFRRSNAKIARAFAEEDVVTVLDILFGRLYTLRNQLMHGSATRRGRVNRSQVRDGAEVIGLLVPLFIEVMMSDAAVEVEEWERAAYPVVND